MIERFSDQRSSGRDRGIAAAVMFSILAVLWWTVGDASRAESRRRYQAALIPDVIPSEPIELYGNIRLIGFEGDMEATDEPGSVPGNRKMRAGCDAVCAALLALPAVDSVTVVNEGLSRAVWRFRLVSKEVCPGPSVIPQQPDSLRPLTASEKAPGIAAGEGHNARLVAARSLETAWRIRLSVADCIIADQVGTVTTFTIRNDAHVAFGDANWRSKHDDWAWTFDALPVSIRRLDIRDSEGEVRFRRSFTSTPMLSKPLLPGAVGSAGPMGFPTFGWSREQLQNFGQGEEYQAPTLLIEHTNIVEGLQATYPTAAISKELRRVLDDSSIPSSDPVFALADTWMRTLTVESITDADKALLVDLVKDRRVTDFQGVWGAVRALGDDAHILAGPIRWRIEMDSDKKSTVHALSAQLSKISEHASGPSEAELRVLNDPEKRLYADGLIIRQGDYGAAAVPLLVRIMREHMERTRNARAAQPGARIRAEIDPIDAAMVALCRIGPDASAAIPEIRTMMSSWVGDGLAFDQQWQFTLARIGWPLSEIKPPQGLNQSQRQYAARLQRRLDTFDEGRDCKESWV